MSGIWAVARNLIREVLRMRILMVFVVLLACSYTGGFAWWLHYGSGPADEKVQTFLSYTLRFTTLVLSLLTVFISIATISREIAHKEIHTVTTKPIRRGELLLGKFLGMAILNLVLLVVIGGVSYGLIRVLAWSEPKTDYERAKIKELVLTARKAVEPTGPDPVKLREEVVSRVNEKIKELQSKEGFSDPAELMNVRADLMVQFEKEIVASSRAVAPGRYQVWRFEGIRPINRENGSVYIRYKEDVSVNPSDNKTYGEWLIGPSDNLAAAEFRHFTHDTIRTVHEFPVPLSAVSDTGDLYVAYSNSPANGRTVVMFPVGTGISALYVAGGFEGNYARSLTAIYIRLLFIGILGLAAGAWLSFPVAVLVVLVIYVLGLSSEFVLEAISYETNQVQANIIRLVMPIFPKLARYDPVAMIEKGAFGVLWHCGPRLCVLAVDQGWDYRFGGLSDF